MLHPVAATLMYSHRRASGKSSKGSGSMKSDDEFNSKTSGER